jgi:hypothetical protein
LFDAGSEFLLEFCEVEVVEAIAFFEEAEGFADDFTGGEVAPAFDFVVDELFEFWGESKFVIGGRSGIGL